MLFVVAAGQGRSNVAAIERIEKIQHALPVKILDHLFSACARLALPVHFERNCAGLIQPKIPAL